MIPHLIRRVTAHPTNPHLPPTAVTLSGSPTLRQATVHTGSGTHLPAPVTHHHQAAADLLPHQDLPVTVLPPFGPQGLQRINIAARILYGVNTRALGLHVQRQADGTLRLLNVHAINRAGQSLPPSLNTVRTFTPHPALHLEGTRIPLDTEPQWQRTLKENPWLTGRLNEELRGSGAMTHAAELLDILTDLPLPPEAWVLLHVGTPARGTVEYVMRHTLRPHVIPEAGESDPPAAALAQLLTDTLITHLLPWAFTPLREYALGLTEQRGNAETERQVLRALNHTLSSHLLSVPDTVAPELLRVALLSLQPGEYLEIHRDHMPPCLEA